MVRRAKQDKDGCIIVSPIEVSINECNGDFAKMLKRFTKKIRKEEVLKPFYGKLMFFTSKGQRKRAKKNRDTWNTKRRLENLEQEDQNS